MILTTKKERVVMTAVFIIIFQVLWSLIVGFVKLIPHGIKYGWIFVVAGIVCALFVRDAAWYNRITPGMAVFLYILSIGGGISLMVLKLWWNKRQTIINKPVSIKKDVHSDYSIESGGESPKIGEKTTKKTSVSDDVSDEYR